MDIQDVAFCDFVAHLVHCAVQAVVDTPLDTADPVVSVLAVIAATSSQRRRDLWRRVLRHQVVEGVRDAIGRQHKASLLLQRYAPAEQRKAAGDLFTRLRLARITTIGVDRVWRMSLQRLIDKNHLRHNFGWQEKLRQVIQAAGLRGHPLQHSMSGFLKELQEQLAGADASSSVEMLDASAPIKGLISMVVEHGPLWVVGRGMCTRAGVCVRISRAEHYSTQQ